MRSWIIDDFGQLFQSGSHDLALDLGRTDGGAAIEQYAIENIGHIGIKERDGRTHIQCRPDILTERTTASLLYWLLDHGAAQVVLSWLDDVWHMERPMACAVAVSFINLLLDRRIPPANSAADAAFLTEYSPAARRRWSEHGEATVRALRVGAGTDACRQALDQMYNGRWLLVDYNKLSQRFETVDRGDGYPPLDPGLVGRRNQFRIETMANSDYRDWVLAGYRDVAAKNQHRFDDVDALVQWPRTGHARTRYWRAVVAIQNNDDLCRLLSVSGSDCSIDLRPQHV